MQRVLDSIQENYEMILWHPQCEIFPKLNEMRNKVYKKLFIERRRTAYKSGLASRAAVKEEDVVIEDETDLSASFASALPDLCLLDLMMESGGLMTEAGSSITRDNVTLKVRPVHSSIYQHGSQDYLHFLLSLSYLAIPSK